MVQRHRPLALFAALLLGATAAGLATRAVAGEAGEPEIAFGRIDIGPSASSTDAAAPAAPAWPTAQPPAETPQLHPPQLHPPQLHPYVGLQAGGSGASLEPLAHANPGGLPASTDPDRHYRAEAGADYALTPKVGFGFDYRYSNAEHPDPVLAPAPDTELANPQRDQAATLSLRYKFGPGN